MKTYPGVIDEALARVELRSSLSVDNEYIRTLNSRARTRSCRHNTEGVLGRQCRRVEASDKAELTDVGLSGGVGSHVDGRVTRLHDIVVG
jgi:hypothetical protein